MLCALYVRALLSSKIYMRKKFIDLNSIQEYVYEYLNNVVRLLSIFSLFDYASCLFDSSFHMSRSNNTLRMY